MPDLIAFLDQVRNRVEAEAVDSHLFEPVRRNLLHFPQHRRRFVIEVRHPAPEKSVIVFVANRRLVPYLRFPRGRLWRLGGRPAIPVPMRARRIAKRFLKKGCSLEEWFGTKSTM